MTEGSGRTLVDCCCCVSGEVNVTVKLNKRVFVPGEPIVIYAEIHNNSNTEIHGSRVSLQQVSKQILKPIPEGMYQYLFNGFSLFKFKLN